MKLGAWLAARPRTTVAVAMLASTLAVWAPFAGSLDKVCRYWDGPPYLYIAGTLYDTPDDHPFRTYDLPRSYFANHLPAYPLLVRALTPLTLGDYPAAMLLATALSAMGAAILFYEVLLAYQLVQAPLWTAIFFCFFPPRWVIYHSVGATEPLFFCFAFAALLALRADRPLLVALFAGLGAVTRMPGALLLPVFAGLYLGRRRPASAAQVAAGGVGLLALFGWYAHAYGDFFAYFTWNADHQGRMISALPLAKFTAYAQTKEFHSTELFAWMTVAYGVGTLALWRHRPVFAYTAAYFAFALFVSHRDLPRYLLPAAPFALLVGFDAVLARPAARWALPLVAYLDYRYAWGYIPFNMVNRGVYEDVLAALAAR